MKINNIPRTSIWAIEAALGSVLSQDRAVGIIDQTLLPFAVEDRILRTVDDIAEAISAMRVRGAPLIGVTAAFGLAFAMRDDPSFENLTTKAALLAATRPTAVNLAWALNKVTNVLITAPANLRAELAWHTAKDVAADDVATNFAIGQHGLKIIEELHHKLQRPVNILTHCNAGWVATVDWGTALSPIYQAHDAGIPVHVWVEETRPRNQGLLTAWELREHGVPHTYIVDNAGGHFMQHGKVDMVIVGADRVSGTGDVANKIGTYQKALAARDNNIPFYAALPLSTIDWTLKDALADIEIEERNAAEIRMLRGVSTKGTAENFTILDAGSPVANPGFDVTPARLITGIITERGITGVAELHQWQN
jgi:methylthioribose-1-phosphate isomerase